MARGLGFREIVSHVGTVLLQRIGSLILQISTVVLLAHLLGAKGFGQYAVAILLPILLGMVLDLGVRSASIYALGRGATILVVLGWNLRLGGAIVACGVILGALLVAGAPGQIFPGVPAQLLWIGICGFPASWFYENMTSVLQGTQDFRRYNLARVMQPAATLVAVVLFVWAADLGAAGAVAAWAGGYAFGFLLAAWFVWRHCAARAPDRHQNTDEKPDLRYGLKAYLANMLAILNLRLDILMVNFFVGPAGAGIYTVAVRVAEQLWVLSSSVAIVLLPRLAGLHSAEEIRRQLTPIVARWVTLAGFAMAMTLALISHRVVPLAFGAEYTQSAAVLLWLLPGVVVYTWVMVVSPDLQARGRPDLNAWAAGVSLAVNVAGNLLLIPSYGVIGAAFASTLSYVISGVITVAFYRILSHNRLGDLVRLGPTDWEMIKTAVATVCGKKA